MIFSLYKVLGIDAGASLGEIRKAYKQQALIHHPDKGGNAASFRLVHLAYGTLSSRLTRKSYDEHLALYEQHTHYDGSVHDDTLFQPDAKTRTPKRSNRASDSRGRLPSDLPAGALGAAVPPKKREVGGQRPRAVLLRSLRRLHVILASQPAELRRRSIGFLSVPLREELAAFIAHHKALFGDISSSSHIGKSVRFSASVETFRFWLCGSAS